MEPKILIVDDEPASRHGFRRVLEKQGYLIAEAADVESAQALVDEFKPHIVLLDVKLATESGLDYLPSLVALPHPPVVIIVTAHGSERMAVEALKSGAYDYLPKPFDIDELRVLVKNAVETKLLRLENEQLRNHLMEREGFGSLIGSSPTMLRVYDLIEKVAPTEISVLITGESGTGKELVAKELHRRSHVKDGPFVALNCAAIPEELVESELFGHEKGAFTGANSRRIGKFELAHGGTLFLDEIGDMKLSTQAKFLRVLEEKIFQRLGGNESVESNARIICATNKDLLKEVQGQRFREDLLYRLSVVSIKLPSLREHREDIMPLIQDFTSKFSLIYSKPFIEYSEEVLSVLLNYDWPGNVRELRNCIERAIVLTNSDEVTLEALPNEMVSEQKGSVETTEKDGGISISHTLPYKDAKKEFERKYIEKCLNRTNGNITQAASLLGIHRQSLQHKLKELGIGKNDGSES